MPETPPEQNIHLPYRQQAQAHHRVLAELAARYTPRGRVLDVGCGLGYALQALHRLNPELDLTGADMDEVCLEQTRAKVPGVAVVRMQADRFDAESLGGGYDTVMMAHVLEHLPHPSEVVRRLLEIVRPGGHLILGVPNPLTPRNVLAMTLRIKQVNPGHLQAWDRRHWVNFLEEGVGLEVVEYAEDEVRIFPARLKQRLPWLGGIQRALRRLLPWWSATQFAVIARPESA